MVEFTRKTFEPYEFIFDEGDAAKTVYVLKSGAVEVRTGKRASTPITLGEIKVGEVFGEVALLENRSHGAAAMAQEKSVVLEVPRAEFMKLLNASDPVIKSVVKHLILTLRKVRDDS